MKKFLFAAMIACLGLFASCDQLGVEHTGDKSGNLYGVWKLDTKTVITKNSDGQEERKDVDHSSVNFFLSLSEPQIAIAKKGSFSQLDLKDVDVDAATFSYNEAKSQISFSKTLGLTEGLIYSMYLSGTFDVLELTDKKLVLQQEVLGVTVIYTYHRHQF